MSSKSCEIIALFDTPIFRSPFTTYILEAAWNIERADCSVTIEDFRNFLREQVRNLLKAIDLEYLGKLTADLQRKVVEEPFVDYATFGLSKDNPAYAEVQDAISRLYVEISKAQNLKEECAHYMTTLKSASDYFKSFASVLTAFIIDEGNEPKLFFKRKQVAEILTTDLEVCRERLTQLRGVVGSVDEILRSRLNLLMRTDSAIRLLCRFNEAEQGINSIQSRRKTTAYQNVDLSDPAFSVEEAKR